MTDEQNEKIEWLKRAKRADDSVKYWRSRLEHDRELARSKKGMSGSGTYGNSSVNSTEDALIKLAETERKVQEKFTELAHIRDEIASAIEKIEDEDLQAVLVWHYLKFLTWEDTAYKMNYSVSAVKRKHKKALEKLTLNELV
ncbi:MAG: DUF1492 domain-containing protein [Ruminococcus sp.]|nr:DUF1492 domain-containing protein [Ruminococcus sp.]